MKIKSKMHKKVLAMLLVMSLFFSSMPISIFDISVEASSVNASTDITTLTLGDNDNLTLSGDTQISEKITVTGTATIDLNGYNLEYTGTSGLFIQVEDGATLTIEDSSDGTRKQTGTWNGTDYTLVDDENGDISGGVIYGGVTRAAVYVREGGTLNFESGTIAGNYSTYNGGAIANSGIVNMYDGAVIKDNIATGSGGAVYVVGDTGETAGTYVPKYAVLNMYGGEISDNTAQNGGAIYTGNQASIVNVKDGTISYNKASASGGAIYNTCGSIEISGGEISYNTAVTGGAVYNDAQYWVGTYYDYFEKGYSLNIYDDALIDNNSATTYGGALYLIYGKTAIAGNASITNNKTTGVSGNGGAIYMNANGTILDMTGGTISESSAYAGGAVCINAGTFNMSAGEITNNNATQMAGVAVMTNAIFNMSGTAAITGNNATQMVGGVHNYGTMNMSGGSITGNNGNGMGNGIFQGGTLNLSGAVTISGNNGIDIDTRFQSNLINIKDSLAGSSVGVYNTNKNTIANVSDYALTESDKVFFSNYSSYGIAYDLDNGTVSFGDLPTITAINWDYAENNIEYNGKDQSSDVVITATLADGSTTALDAYIYDTANYVVGETTEATFKDAGTYYFEANTTGYVLDINQLNGEKRTINIDQKYVEFYWVDGDGSTVSANGTVYHQGTNDEVTPQFSETYGIVDGDDVTITYTGANTDTTNNYTTASITALTGDDADNYNIAYSNGKTLQYQMAYGPIDEDTYSFSVNDYGTWVNSTTITAAEGYLISAYSPSYYPYAETSTIFEGAGQSVPLYIKNETTEQITYSVISYNCDITDPEVELSYTTYADWHNTVQTVTISASDYGSGVDTVTVTYGNNKDAVTVVEDSGEYYFQATKNGTYTVTVTDAAGNSISDTFTEVKLDTTAPVISSVTSDPVQDSWSTYSVELEITASDETDGSGIYMYSINGTSYQTSNEFTVTANETYSITAKDNAGNVSEAYTYTVNNIDTEKPVIAVEDISTDWAIYKKVSFTVSDSKSGIKSNSVKITDEEGSEIGFVSSNGSYAFGVTKNSICTITVTDNAGNTATKEITVTNIDTTKPVVSYTNVSNADVWTNDNKTVSVAVIDSESETDANDASGIASIVIRDSENNIIENTDIVNNVTTFEAEQNDTYTITLTDNAGNYIINTVTVDKIDKTAPSTPLIVADVTDPTNGTVTLTVTSADEENGSGFENYYYIVNGVTDESSSDTKTYSFNTEVTVYTMDNAGNKSAETKYSITNIDKIDPTITLDDYSADWSNNDKTVTLTIADAATTDYYSQSGIDTVEITGTDSMGNTVTYTVSGDEYVITAKANVTITVKVTDEAGNITTQDFEVSKIDKAKPTIEVTENDSDFWINTDREVTFTTADLSDTVNENSGIETVTVTNANGDNVDYTYYSSTGEYVFKGENGTYTITTTDYAGNKVTEIVEIVKVDKIIPTITEVTASTTEYTNGTVTLTVTASDLGGSELAAQAYSFDGGLTWQTENTKTFDENQKAVIYVIDVAGNKSEITKYAIENIDQTAPSGEITIQSNGFKEFINAITFNLFFKDYVDVAISATDEISGVASVEYQKVDIDGTYDENGTWTAGTDFSVTANEQFVVYAKITDNADNVTIINSDGVTVYTDSEQDTTSFDFTKSGTDTDKTVKVTLNGNTVNSVIAGERTLSAEYYTVNGNELTFSASYLETLTRGETIFTITYLPMGTEYVDDEDNQAPTSTKATANIYEIITDNTDTVQSTVYNNAEQSPTAPTADTVDETLNIMYQDDNGEYTLNSIPSFINIGTYTVKYELSADNHIKAYGEIKFTITQASSAVVITDVSDASYGNDITLTATVSGVNGEIPSGTVTFYNNGTELATSEVLNGLATYTMTSPIVNEYSITAKFTSTDDNYNNSETASAKTFDITQASSAVVITDITSTTYENDITLTATVSGVNGEIPSGTVTFYNNGTELGTSEVLNGLATYTMTSPVANEYSITAKFTSTDDNYNNSETASATTFSITKASQEIEISSVTGKEYNDADFKLSVTGQKDTGDVTYSVPENNGVVTITGDVVTIIGTGTVTITASVAGNDNYNSDSTTYDLTIAQDQAPVIAFPTSSEITYGDTLADSTLTDSSVYGTFVWTDSTVIPTVANNGFEVTFVPSEDTIKNYATIENTTAIVAVTVAKKEVTVTIDSYEIVRGMEIPTIISTVEGDIVSEIVSPEYSVTDDNMTAGEYEITMANVGDYPNYDITVTAGTLKITSGYTVSFDDLDVTDVAYGASVAQPTDPTKEDFIFKGWFIGTEEFDFATVITEDLAIESTWEAVKEKEFESAGNADVTIETEVEEQLKEELFTEEEVAQNLDMKVTVKVDIVELENMDETAQTEFDAYLDTYNGELEENEIATQAVIFDISVIKSLAGVEETITNLTTPITITIDIPEEYQSDNREFFILRNHEGTITILKDLDNDPTTITIETDRFSNYTLNYTEVIESETDLPDTGDSNSPQILLFILFMSALGILVVGKKKLSK